MFESTPRRDVIAIGASAGGFNVLLDLASRLPANLPAAVLIVLHIGAHPSRLPELLSARGPNPAVHPQQGQALRHGMLYVAPPDRHLLVHDDRLQLSRGALEHHARPAIDPLFRSVALACGPRAIAVVLSGRLDDGTAGALAIKQCGGMVVVQSPEDADHPSMPASVCANVEVDRCVPQAALADTLLGLLAPPLAAPVAAPEWIVREQRISEGEADAMEDLDHIGRPSAFACPDCDGVLWEIAGSRPTRFRCHTGHAFSLRSLEYTQSVTTNKALWGALRALQEREALLRARVARSRQQGEGEETDHLEAQLHEVSRQSAQLHAMVIAA